jgi:tRNA modification GTPase
MHPSSRRGPDQSGYLSEDTIAAISTAVGGAISMIRVSGPEAWDHVSRLARDLGERPEPRKLVRAILRDSTGMPLDDALIVSFVAPASFTGEDCIELHLHGGAYVAGRVLEELLAGGTRQALPGEFSFRAIRSGKLTLSQAEATADLIAATNDGALALALEKMSGSQNRLVTEIGARMRQLAMMGEVGIDFADQDVEEVSLPALKARAKSTLAELAKLRSSYARGAKLQDGIPVAFVGLPNAGKSSFFNALLGEDRSIVSEIAGTTRDVVRERLTLRSASGSVTLRLEDTAGLRRANDQVERMGIERTEKSAREADLILLVVDSASSDAELESLYEHWRALGEPSVRTLGILTKCDRVDRSKALSLERFALKAPWVETSALNGDGIAEAAERIVKMTRGWIARGAGEVLLTRLDHVNSVSRALGHLERALDAEEVDLFAADLKHALHALSPLIGETLPDDILGQIFSSFCIGK